MRNARLTACLVVLLVFGAISALWAADWTLESYKLKAQSEANLALPSAPAVVLGSPISSPDASSITATPVRPRDTAGCPRVVVAPTLSDNTATACLAVVLYHKVSSTYSFGCIAAIQTFTGTTAMTSDSGRFTTTDFYLVVPTLGCQTYDVRLLAISAGSITWRSWRLGPDSAAAGTSSE